MKKKKLIGAYQRTNDSTSISFWIGKWKRKSFVTAGKTWPVNLLLFNYLSSVHRLMSKENEMKDKDKKKLILTAESRNRRRELLSEEDNMNIA